MSVFLYLCGVYLSARLCVLISLFIGAVVSIQSGISPESVLWCVRVYFLGGGVFIFCACVCASFCVGVFATACFLCVFSLECLMRVRCTAGVLECVSFMCMGFLICVLACMCVGVLCACLCECFACVVIFAYVGSWLVSCVCVCVWICVFFCGCC